MVIRALYCVRDGERRLGLGGADLPGASCAASSVASEVEAGLSSAETYTVAIGLKPPNNKIHRPTRAEGQNDAYCGRNPASAAIAAF